jgi:hypothetical protein
MAIKKSPCNSVVNIFIGFSRSQRFSVFLAALFLLASHLSAQNPRFIQRLAWIGDAYTLRYEVQVEREEETGYRRIVREYTENFFIELTLPAGKYRYRVIPYDYLNRPREGSEWVNMEVLTALYPQLYDISPRVFFIGQAAAHTLEIFGANLQSGAEFSLHSPDAVIVPAETQSFPDGSQARLRFGDDRLIPGIYELLIRNPGGLETRGAEIRIAYSEIQREPEPEPEPERGQEPEVDLGQEAERGPEADTSESHKPFYIDLSAAWMPLLPLYGDSGFFGKDMTASGTGARLGLVYTRPEFFNAGLELASWYVFRNDRETKFQTTTTIINLLAEKPFRTAALRFRLGLGLSSDEYFTQLNTGLSFVWLVQKQFYFEAGIDHVHLLFTDISTGCIRPWFGVGLRF